MAAAILRHLAGRRMYVESAGVRAGGSDHFAETVMEEIGISISDHKPHTLRDLNDTSFDVIVTLSPEAHHQALELTRTMAVDVEYWPTFDATMVVGHGIRIGYLRSRHLARHTRRRNQQSALRASRGRTGRFGKTGFAVNFLVPGDRDGETVLMSDEERKTRFGNRGGGAPHRSKRPFGQRRFSGPKRSFAGR